MQKLTYTVTDTNKYKILKDVIKDYFQISEKLLHKLKENKKILLNNEFTYMHKPLNINDEITVDLHFDEETENIVPVYMPLDILYEDEWMLIINKGPNLPMHPSILHYEDSLSNGVKYYFEQNNIKRKIRIVNRLDKDTSGIVIISKSEYIQECLIKQMKNKTFSKEYIAFLEGFLEEDSGIINANIKRKENSIIEREISEDGQTAVTYFNVIDKITINDLNLSIVNFKLETGRTHQIRLHSRYINHPIIGDTLYNKPSDLISRQALHAYKISFIHPITKKVMNFKTSLPSDMSKIYKI